MGKGLPGALVFQADSRSMPELAAESVPLIVTSPPYWQIKDYGDPAQIGHGQSLHEYLRELMKVWAECFRVSTPGGRLCVNVGDQFARASLYGRYRVIPLHAEIIGQCSSLGYDFMGSIIWRKKTTMNTSGGAVVMGSYPYPPNGIVEIDFEYILLFKKPGTPRTVPAAQKKKAALTRDEWKGWFSGHWEIVGARKKGHEAPFPEEIPSRLIRMFSFPGDTVLDPFLGTGTTAKAAVEHGRRAVGYEIVPAYAEQARARLERAGAPVELRVRAGTVGSSASSGAWMPSSPDLQPVSGSRPDQVLPPLQTVTSIGDDGTLVLDSGETVGFLGLRVTDLPAAVRYLRERILKKRVFLKDGERGHDGIVRARVMLKNRISINTQLLKMGAAAQEKERA
jgi:DNA modification methylase